MKPLFVLLISFAAAAIIIKTGWPGHSFCLAGSVAMAIMLLFTAMGHFIFTKGMVLMVPGFIPYKRAIVYMTGLIEIIAAIGLAIPATRTITGWLLIVFFLALLPANINAAMQHIDHEKANAEGKGRSYLWFRIPLQLFFIAWVYLFVIHS